MGKTPSMNRETYFLQARMQLRSALVYFFTVPKLIKGGCDRLWLCMKLLYKGLRY